MPLLLDLHDQTLVDPKPHSFATRTPCTWGHSTIGRGRDCQSLDSDVLANKESASTRSAISVPQGCWLMRTEFSVGTMGQSRQTRRTEGEYATIACVWRGGPNFQSV